jgi:Ca-activated chloride channel family protein
MPNTNTPQILITPLKPALIQGMAQKLPVLVRVQAPDPEPGQKKERRPYHLSLVIDRSGSMSGEPLLEAVRCARHIVDRLDATDVASLTVFDDRVKTLAPAQPVGDRKALHMALAQVRSGGSTNLHGGWLAGAKSILAEAKTAALARVILLSDGNANVGDTTDTDEIAALCADAAEKGVTTSTYGLGRDFNEDLMVEMGKRGGGNHYYGATAADLFEPFAEEFDFISSLYARQVCLALYAPNGINITLINNYPVEQRAGFPLIRLPDIPLGAEAWALVELEIPAGMALESGSPLLQASVTATDTDETPIAYTDATLALQVMSPPAWETLLQDPLVVARQTELEAGKFLNQARAVSEQGDWDTVQKMISEGRRRFADHPWVMDILENLTEIAAVMDSARYRKESVYTTHRMNSRVASKVEAPTCMADEAAAPSFLRRRKSQGKAQYEQRPQDEEQQ